METESVERLLKLFTITELARLYDCTSEENNRLKGKLNHIEECINSTEDGLVIIKRIKEIIKNENCICS